MKTRSLIAFVCLTLTILVERVDAERPNLVLILTDDQAPWALGLSGHPHAKTPDMDRSFKQEWKLIRDFRNEGRDELYNLKADLAESTNLVSSDDEKAKWAREALGAAMLIRMREIDDPALKQDAAEKTAAALTGKKS